MSILLILQILLTLVTAMFAYVARSGRNVPKGEGNSTIQAIEAFADQLEEDNDRMLTILEGLQQRVEWQEKQYRLELEQMKIDLHGLKTHIDEVEKRLDRPGSENPEIHGDSPMLGSLAVFNARYAKVAQRLMAGDDKASIHTELQVGFGEIELVQGIMLELGILV